MYLFLAFALVPIIEIALFIQVGGLIGLWPTLAIVVLTAIIGTSLMRSQGRRAMGRLRRSFSELNDPTEPLADGAMILLSGALLLTPGFFTDAVGFLLLTPPVRAAVLRWLRARVSIRQFQMGPAPRSGPHRADPHGDVIEGEYTEVRPKRDQNAAPSGWVEPPKRH